MPLRIGNGSARVVVGEAVDDLERRVALERLGDAAAGLAHRVRVVAVDDGDRDARVGGEVARLARRGLGEERDALALHPRPHRDAVW